MVETSEMRVCSGLNRDCECIFRACYFTVERVPLEGLATGLANDPDQVLAPHSLRSGCACIVIDLLFNHGAINIISPEAQRDLRDLWGHHLPVGLDMGEIVQQQAAYGNLAQVHHSGRAWKVFERSVVWMKGQWNKSLEAVCFVLQRAQLEEMVHAVFVIFYVAI